MTNPTVLQAIAYYRKVAEEATRAADSLEGLLKILGEEGEIYFPAAPKRKYTRKAKRATMAPVTPVITGEEIRNYLGSSSKRIKDIAEHFVALEDEIRSLVTLENGLDMRTRGWVHAV
jgi:hypothetical protein